MIACICGFQAETEGDLMSHFIECHRRSYALETCIDRETCSALKPAQGPEENRKKDPQ